MWTVALIGLGHFLGRETKIGVHVPMLIPWVDIGILRKVGGWGLLPFSWSFYVEDSVSENLLASYPISL